MKTEQLIEMLARGAGMAPRMNAVPRLVPVLAGGALLSAAAALLLLGWVPREMYALPAPWIKLAYAGLLALAAMWLAVRLSRPVARLAAPARGVALVVLGMAVLALGSLAAAPSGERIDTLLGDSWLRCPVDVFLLSLPTLVGALWVMRGLAPTRLREAGFAAGVLAGAVGAAGYALSCPETSLAFIGVWYTAGVALAGALGAWLGPRVLRW
ncbi:MAG: DUF1109 domain-containing protein [Burkholderiaceae bacterium]|nr:DUF1109 domain-containing protein [Burkholderiaceae bacterium]